LCGVAEIDEFAVFPLPYLRTFQKYDHIKTTRHSGFLPAPTRMTWNDLECPVQLKVCMSHGLLADRVDSSVLQSLASLLKSCTTLNAVFSEVYGQ